MKKIFKKLILGSVSACMLLTSAFAATITPSESVITLSKENNQISFDIILESDIAFAGAEFGLLPSETDVIFESVNFSNDLKNESNVQTVKDGCLYFGFFSNSNKYTAGTYTVATVNYSYSGTGTRTIRLKDSKIVTIEEGTNKTIGDTSSAPFTITIKRASSNPGGGSSGGSRPSVGGSGGSPITGGTISPGITVPDTNQPLTETTFEDITDHWAKDDIMEAAKKGYFTGTSATTFSPDGNVTRAMAVTVLGRFAKAGDTDASIPFTDVPPNAYYRDYVAWGAESGVVKGISTTEFAPDFAITREQISAMLIRYLSASNILLPEMTDEINTHSDYDKISDYARDSMTLCYDLKLITGHDSGLLAPQGNLTRAEFAVIMLRLEQYVNSAQK